jgi:carboxymethylenebutenolidase
MGEAIDLTARDGHRLNAYRALPDGTPHGGVVIVQEIFGLTDHITRVVDRYASEGFAAAAPAMFDRIEPNIVLDYGEIETGRGLMRQLQWDQTLIDVGAALDAVAADGPAAVVGFCWGGTVAHVAACELALDAAVSYYGGGIVRFLNKQPNCPIIYHFGDRDPAIPPDDIERIRASVRGAEVYVYPGAGHGFNCEDREAYSPTDAELAFERSVAFLRAELAG